MAALAAIPLAVWTLPLIHSFRANRYGTRRRLAALSAVFSASGAVAVFAYTVIADFNDYPGFTCEYRGGVYREELLTALPSAFYPTDLAAQSHSGPASLFSWAHAYELFPVGMRCTYWATGHPDVSITTHSHWGYTVVFYALIAVMIMQAFRVLRPGVRAT